MSQSMNEPVNELVSVHQQNLNKITLKISPLETKLKTKQTEEPLLVKQVQVCSTVAHP